MTSGESEEITRRLVHVRYAVAAVGEAEHALSEAVATARSVGASWDQVAELLGLSPTAAEEKFAAITH